MLWRASHDEGSANPDDRTMVTIQPKLPWVGVLQEHLYKIKQRRCFQHIARKGSNLTPTPSMRCWELVGDSHQKRAGGRWSSKESWWEVVIKRDLVGDSHQKKAGGRWSSKESWWEVVIKRELVGNGQQKRASGR